MKPKIALCLPGGGITGAMYQIGALAALADVVQGFQANDLSLYVGTSSGASVAAACYLGQVLVGASLVWTGLEAVPEVAHVALASVIWPSTGGPANWTSGSANSAAWRASSWASVGSGTSAKW